MKTVFYCTIPTDHTEKTNDIHKKIDRIYKEPNDTSPCPRWCTNGSLIEVVSDKMPIHCDKVYSIREVHVPNGSLTLSFQYPAIRRKEGHLKVYDSPAIAKKQICEKVCARLAELGMSDVRVMEYVHNVCRIDLSDRKHGVSKLPVSFIVVKCFCQNEDNVHNLMVNGIGKFRFAGLGMIYVTEG